MSFLWKIAQAAELRWWQKYLRRRQPGDYHAWKRSYWLNFLRKLEITFRESEKILDAGCGPAGVFMVLEWHQVDALDPLIGDYEAALAHFRKEDYRWVRFQQQSIEELESVGRYDTTFCLNVVNHVCDLPLSLDRLVAAVKPGGRLVLSVDTHNWLVFKYLFRLLRLDILHPHQCDQAEYRRMLELRGVRIDREIVLKREFFFSYRVFVGTVSPAASTP
jgi:2-polyprenyl-6-hydroxyphenyl methylase/3-demethylubiquinone-9 3-methyltransferase